jgi:hypothetical protein
MQTEINSINKIVHRVAKATTPPVDLREVEALCKELGAECKGLEKACAN